MFANIALLSAPYSTLTYSLPREFPDGFWQTGLRVLMPVARSLRSGIITSLDSENRLEEHIQCRSIVFPQERAPLVNDELVSLVSDLAARQGRSLGETLGHVLPAGLRKPDFKIIWRNGTCKRALTARSVAALSQNEYASLVNDFLSGNALLARATQNAAELEICAVAIDPPWPLRPGASRQIEIMDFLHEHGPASRALILKKFGSGASSPLQKLIAARYVTVDLAQGENDFTQGVISPPPPEFSLTTEQEHACGELVSALSSPLPETRLLYGVTGSGKTAIYLELAKACIARGSPCLLLAPEVALAHKLYRDVAKAIPDAPAFLYHGYQHPLQRERLFRAVAGLAGPCLIVGTRSALFLPLRHPACIIMDEEHDASYKQDENLPYHAKELAWCRIQRTGGLLILGSATPDIRTFHACRSGLIKSVRLGRRVSGGPLPPIELVGINPKAGFSPTPSGQGLLSTECEDALSQCLKKGEQAVILLNRRGYAPLIYCLSCEQTIRCPHCQIGMAFHKSSGKLVCHYCGHALSWPSPCPECGDTNYISIGEGTERITERLEALAGQKILRLDRDTARRTGSIDEILSGFGAGAAPFLVGTQMLSKGHHFPNVTLVVVADGDIGLNLPDYRAAERTFQLLLQSAGRAGRGLKPGRALIQTRNQSHYCWQHVVNYDYEGFYEAELALRKRYLYPPFTRLGMLRISWAACDDDAAASARELGNELKRVASGLGLIFMGPAPAPIAMIKGRKRTQCLIKAQEWQPMRELWFIAQKHKAARKLRIFLDLDPVNML